MKKRLSDLIYSAVLAGGLAILLDFASVMRGRALSVPKFGILLIGLFLGLWLIPAVTSKVRKWGVAVLGMAVALLAAAVLCWNGVSQNAGYHAPDQGKKQLYGGQKVMLLVPHQDDDINVLGGVIEEYRKYGSEVYIVFSTNGDYVELAETRFGEALTAAQKMGVGEDHVIFLGYGDQWAPDGPHIYNAAPGEVVTSHLGETQTYGTTVHEVFREGRAYTLENFLGDIEGVILEYRPDILYCVDLDYHSDHRALSLAFETVMGRILKEQTDYRPMVFKGYAYDTAWEAEEDFYAENLLSTQNVFQPPYGEKPEVYRWEERMRLPVHGEGLSRSVLSAGMGDILASYESQGAQLYAVRIINSDKVFWQRRTDSLCHQAEIQGSTVLNDFKLLDDRDLLSDVENCQDGAWIPENDQEAVTVTFDSPRDVETVVLYDLYDKTVNVRNARIAFDNGAVVETGPLDSGGAATRITVNQHQVTSFAVTLTDREGEAGLTEIEAFDSGPRALPFIKLMDEEGNFLYDYWIDSRGDQLFSLYTSGAEGGQYTLECSNDACGIAWEGDKIRVHCPVGEHTVVTVTSEDGSLSDSVFIQNPGRWERRYILFWLRAEEKILDLCATKLLRERLFVCRLWDKLPVILNRIGL